MGGAYSTPEIKSKHYDDFVAKLPSQAGKQVAITGTTTGLGFHAARALVAKGATVYCLNRPSERAQAAVVALQEAAKDGGGAAQIDCDLQSFDSVKAAAASVKAALGDKGLDVLANNAGIMAMPDKATRDGYPQEMQTNHLSHFLLTSELMGSLKKAAGQHGQARVVNHSSGARKVGGKFNVAHYQKTTDGKLGGDGQGPRRERYHQTKLANMLFTSALQDHVNEAGLNILCLACVPGLAASSLQATSASSGSDMFYNVLMKFAQSAEDGCLPLLSCIASPNMAKGQFMVPRNKGVLGSLLGDGVTGLPVAQEPEKMCVAAESKSELWRASQEAVGAFQI